MALEMKLEMKRSLETKSTLDSSDNGKVKRAPLPPITAVGVEQQLQVAPTLLTLSSQQSLDMTTIKRLQWNESEGSSLKNKSLLQIPQASSLETPDSTQ